MFANNLKILSVVITTILINLKTGICLFNYLNVTNFIAYSYIVSFN